jgi:hypothetical protein
VVRETQAVHLAAEAEVFLLSSGEGLPGAGEIAGTVRDCMRECPDRQDVGRQVGRRSALGPANRALDGRAARTSRFSRVFVEEGLQDLIR